MNKILLLGLLLSTSVFSQDASEEAIILNQELQFLEDSANNVSVSARVEKGPALSEAAPASQLAARPIDTGSLEAQYFGENNEEPVRTRAAAPKRRSN